MIIEKFVLQRISDGWYYGCDKGFSESLYFAKVFNNKGTPRGIITNSRNLRHEDYQIRPAIITITEEKIGL